MIPDLPDILRCIACRGSLRSAGPDLDCADCGKRYPVVDGMPILVPEPYGFIRAEISRLTRTYRSARQRIEALEESGAALGLPKITLERLRAVHQAEAARAGTFLDLMMPAADALERGGMAGPHEALADVRHDGWRLDALVPFLLRDWTGTPEIDEAAHMVAGALHRAFPEAADRTIAFGGCGAGGLLAMASPGFERVFGFDLALPVLVAARRLLDGGHVDLALPLPAQGASPVRLAGRPGAPPARHVMLGAMDAFRTAFADGALDCVVTAFLLDLLADPRPLAEEIHRVLAEDGVWINYGPSGPREAPRRFDGPETAAFAEAAGFVHVCSDRHRTTFLDLTRHDPGSSFQSHVCHLTTMRKTASPPARPHASGPVLPADLAGTVPCHHPGATLLHQEVPGDPMARVTMLQFEDAGRQSHRFEIGPGAARVFAHVDGRRTVHEVAQVLAHGHASDPASFDPEDTVRAFARYFELGLLRWRDPVR